MYASVKADAVAYKKLTFLVELVLDLAGIRRTLPGFAKGRELVMKQFACAHIYSLEELMTMDTKSIIGTLDAVEGKIMAAAKQLGDFMRIEKREQVLRDLGLWLHEVTADIVGFVTLSEKMWASNGVDLSDDEMKLIPIPNEVNIFIVKEAVSSILEDNNLGFLLETDWDFKRGVFFFQNRWLARVLSKRLRRLSNSHLVNGVTFNGVEAFKKMCDTYLPQEKVDALLCRLHKNFEQLKLIQVKDYTHSSQLWGGMLGPTISWLLSQHRGGTRLQSANW